MNQNEIIEFIIEMEKNNIIRIVISILLLLFQLFIHNEAYSMIFWSSFTTVQFVFIYFTIETYFSAFKGKVIAITVFHLLIIGVSFVFELIRLEATTSPCGILHRLILKDGV